MSTPATKIYLCSDVPLNNRYDHTLYFANSIAQHYYFKSKVAHTLTDYSYVRKTWKLKVAASVETARAWSYLYFENGSGKRYFYFINQIEYISDNAVELSLEIDVLQTYMFDWVLRPCFIEREHSVTDVFGANTVDEGLDVGEYRVGGKESINLSSNMVVMVASTIDLNKFYIDNVDDKIGGAKYDNLFGGFELTAVPMIGKVEWDNMSITNLIEVLYALNSSGKGDAVFSMWQYPGELLEWTNGEYETAILKYVSRSKDMYYKLTARPGRFGNYTPKNQKVFQYPYSMIYVTNNQGGAAVYHYEQFTSDEFEMRIHGNLAPDAVVKLTPMDYKGSTFNDDESLTLGTYPACAWNSDSYKMWLAQNQNQQNFGFAMEGLKILGGVAAIAGGAAATGATAGAGAGVGVAGITSGVGLITSGVTGIASQLAQRADRSIQPPQARGNYSGSHNIARGLHNFDVYHKQIDEYHARMIDEYFTMFGYATRRVKIPNISSRPAFNYVKTIGSNVGGNICMEDLQMINSIFDKGVTFWKNTDVGNYDLDNTP